MYSCSDLHATSMSTNFYSKTSMRTVHLVPLCNYIFLFVARGDNQFLQIYRLNWDADYITYPLPNLSTIKHIHCPTILLVYQRTCKRSQLAYKVYCCLYFNEAGKSVLCIVFEYKKVCNVRLMSGNFN